MPRAKRIKAKPKQYSTVSEMVEDLSDKIFVDEFKRQLEAKAFTSRLFAIRVTKWPVAKEYATLIGWTNKRLMGFESSKDGNKTFADIRQYAFGLGYKIDISEITQRGT